MGETTSLWKRDSETIVKTTGCGNLNVHVLRDDDGNIVDILSNLGRSGGCAAAGMEVTCRLIHKLIKRGEPIESIIESLRGVACPNPGYDGAEENVSCFDAVGKALEQALSRNPHEEKDDAKDNDEDTGT